jgi:hypothetical protein
MGLLPEHADLVVQVFVEQTNRAIIRHDETIDLTSLRRFPADARVVAEPLPSEESWEEAHRLARIIFRVDDVSEMRTARNVALLASRVRQAAGVQAAQIRKLLGALLECGPWVLPDGADPSSTDRVRIATDSLRLCEAIARIEDDLPLVERLAASELRAAPEHVRRGFDNADGILRAIGVMHWPHFQVVTLWGPEHPLGDKARALATDLATAWVANEFVHPLSPAVDLADKRARTLFDASNKRRYQAGSGSAGGEPAIVTPPAGTEVGTVLVATALPAQGTRVVDESSVAEVAAGLTELTTGGRRVSLTWQVLE